MPLHISHREHGVLYDFHTAEAFEGKKKIIELNGEKYEISTDSKDKHSAKRITINFSDFFGNSGKTSAFITAVLNSKNKWYEHCGEIAERKAISGIALSGGGAKAVTYIGILERLGDKKLQQITEVSGTSAGAITGVFIAVGMTANDVKATVKKQPLFPNQDELEKGIKAAIVSALKQAPYSGHLPDVLNNKDIFSDDDIGNITFAQLENLRTLSSNDADNLSPTLKKLFISASSLDQKNNGYNGDIKFCSETTPNVSIAKAALASSAIPPFSPVEFEPSDFKDGAVKGMGELRKEGQAIKLVDGGAYNQTPYNYLTTDNKLILSFVEDKGSWGIFKKEPNILQKITDWFSNMKYGVKIFEERLKSQKEADRKHGVHYINSGLQGFQTWTAMANLDAITVKSAKDFDYHLRFQMKKIHSPKIMVSNKEEKI